MSNIIIPEGVATVQSPDDLVAQTVSSIELTLEEANLLRAYKKFLLKRDLREAVYCNFCWGHSLADGTEFHVTDNDILIKCRCSLRYYKGSTY